MNLAYWKKFVFATLATALVVAAVSLNSIGQEAKKADPKAKAGAKEKPKGRLPAYYKDVVTDEQRDQIYAIQAKYAKQLDDLQSQLDAVKAKQNDEIEGLLSAEQKEKLAKVKAEADAKKKSAKKGDGDKAAAPAASAEPAKTTTESPKKTK
jgi:Spy/CpxP family protein refolding chaperone